MMGCGRLQRCADTAGIELASIFAEKTDEGEADSE